MASTELPPLTHVALTVRDLSVGVPWYEALLEAKPVLDEDTDPDFHHTVYLLGNGNLLGLHQHGSPAPEDDFSEYRVGLDHVSFGVANRAELENWAQRQKHVASLLAKTGGRRRAQLAKYAAAPSR